MNEKDFNTGNVDLFLKTQILAKTKEHNSPDKYPKAVAISIFSNSEKLLSTLISVISTALFWFKVFFI